MAFSDVYKAGTLLDSSRDDVQSVGRAIAALAADPEVMSKTGGAFSSWGLAKEYGYTDIDGRRPDWGRYFAEHVAIEAA